MCFDICTINIRVSIRVRGLHLVSQQGARERLQTLGQRVTNATSYVTSS